ncbi:MAG: D-alanyl-D-alanine carboxypeptidase [Clostridia bacterium]|nr:D-alanyl-D-alanine carboxypeptidase [Clostridia bacterium]
MFFSKKIICFIVLLSLIAILPTCCFADDYIEPIDDFVDVNSIVTSSSVSSLPNINSRSAVVIERSTGAILFGKNELDVRKMASTTKIMTAIIVLENEPNLSNTVTVSSKAARIHGSRLGLSTNCKVTVNDLLYGLMLCSGNDAAIALAEHIGGSVENFANLMNQKAELLGLSNTNFVTPHGLDDDEHHTTAYELALLTNYALENETFRTLVGTSNYTVYINGSPKNIHSTNELLGNLNGVYGVKTGFTNGANRCLVSSCKRGDLDVICVVLGADTKKFRTQDSVKIIEYAFSNFKMMNIKEPIMNDFQIWKNDNLHKFNIDKCINSSVDVYLSELPYDYYPVNKNIDNIYTDFTATFNFEAPFYKDCKVGTVDIIVDNKIIFSLDFYNLYTIEKRSISDYFNMFFSNYINYFEDII